MPEDKNDILKTDSGVRLRDHIALRWLAIIGQSAAVFVAYVMLALPLPLMPICVCVGLSVALNLWLTYKPRSYGGDNLSHRHATYYLGYDLVQLTALLALTGGLANPFAVLLLAPVTVAASLADIRATLAIMICAVIAVIILFFTGSFFNLGGFNLGGFDLGGFDLEAFPVAQAAGLVLALVFIPAYVWWVSRAGRQLINANAAMASLLERAQHLSALDGLAAAAAHELGTPLGTIYLTSGELAKSNLPDAIKDDIQIIRREAEKCRVILSNLSRNGLHQNPDDMLNNAALDDVITNLIETRSAGIADEKQVHFSIKDSIKNSASAVPHIRTLPELIYSIGNVLDNALAFATHNVWVVVSYDTTQITIEISDDGTGFAPDILARLGTPYNTSYNKGHNTNNKESMGLGFFIAQSLLGRLGGTCRAENLSDKESHKIIGARVVISVPLESIASIKD